MLFLRAPADVVVLTLLLHFGRSLAAVLSSSKLQSCVNDGSDEIQCDKKIVLAITIEQGQDETEQAEFTVSEVVDESENQRDLVKPLRVSWKKTPAFWRYPIRYLQDVNNKPIEKIIKVGGLQCRDGANNKEEDLTCGVAKKEGMRIEDSEGFCCGCDLNDVTAGLPTRGQLDCSIFSMGESAHCLAFDPLWYSVFEVDRPQMFYDISVTLSTPVDPQASWDDIEYQDSQVIVSHLQPMAKSSEGEVRVELSGDLATAIAPHRFDSQYLAVPNRPDGHPRVSKETPLSDAMLIDRHLFDLSGRSCDRIGVSFTAFKNQAHKCERQAGSCLSGQLDDLHVEDEEREANNQQTRYLVRGFCEGALKLGEQNNGASGKTRFLACPLEQRHTTLMRLEVKAEDVMLVTNVATGQIVSAKVKSFEAFQGRGEVVAVALSTGHVTAEFALGITNCTLGFTSGPALRFSLVPFATSEHRIALHASQTKGGKASCVLCLYNALGDVLETRRVEFNVTDLQETTGVQVPVDRPDSKVSHGSNADNSCASLCPSMFAVMCFVASGCWKQLGMLLFGIGGVCVGGYICLWASMRGLPCKLMRCMCAPLFPKQQSSGGDSLNSGASGATVVIQQAARRSSRCSRYHAKLPNSGLPGKFGVTDQPPLSYPQWYGHGALPSNANVFPANVNARAVGPHVPF